MIFRICDLPLVLHPLRLKPQREPAETDKMPARCLRILRQPTSRAGTI